MVSYTSCSFGICLAIWSKKLYKKYKLFLRYS